MKSVLIRRILQEVLQVHPNRSFPVFAGETFKKWLRTHPQQNRNGSPDSVVLFNDTYTNYNEPDIGRAALTLLESTGSRVFIPDVVCCGRTMISKGFLDQARENAIKNVARLTPFVESGAYIIGLEPSCLAALRDEYPDLVHGEAARKLADRSLLLEEYLALQLDSGKWKPAFKDIRRSVLLHGHCHQKSLVGTGSAIRLLKLPPGYTVTEIESGCCGMAGAFGYEKEHYAISMQIAEMKLLPAIRAAAPDAEIVADGISCRQQIHHGTGRKARHFAEVLAQALEYNQS
jgi:Fe-S oxidoreductase